MPDDRIEQRRRAMRAVLEEGRGRLAAAGIDDPLREAELLLARVLGVERTAIHADPPPPSAEALERFRTWIEARAARMPVAYILGEAEFWSLTFTVTPDVLVPRPESEHLVTAALERLSDVRGPRIVDVGTGSGCLAAVLAHERSDARLLAVDVSAAALRVAQGNLHRLGLVGRVLPVLGDMLSAVRGPVDLVISNPPYVGDDEEVDPECLAEPRAAVFAGADALACYRTLASQVKGILAPGGVVVVELPGDSADEIADLFRAGGLCPEPALPDLAGRPRVLLARR